ncbi:MAG TPA: hypothetical protein VMT99_00185 [Candidatus Paceibacterota bacterium]|nr:hypothetical protein [Candidatus Paceibacterota bacterium]
MTEALNLRSGTLFAGACVLCIAIDIVTNYTITSPGIMGLIVIGELIVIVPTFLGIIILRNPTNDASTEPRIPEPTTATTADEASRVHEPEKAIVEIDPFGFGTDQTVPMAAVLPDPNAAVVLHYAADSKIKTFKVFVDCEINGAVLRVLVLAVVNGQQTKDVYMLIEKTRPGQPKVSLTRWEDRRSKLREILSPSGLV